MSISLLPSLIRTVVPLVVGWVLGWLPAELGLTEAQLTGAGTVLVVIAYYVVARLLEQVWPRAGVLLGWPAEPSYDVSPREPRE